MRFELTVTPEIVFAPGSLATLGEHAARFGKRALLVTGGGSLDRLGVIARVEAMLAERDVRVTRVAAAGEPDTGQVDAASARARADHCDVVIGVGGGSALDSAKAVACLLANGGESLDYLEVVGRGRPIEKPSAPFVAVPTTGARDRRRRVTRSSRIGQAAPRRACGARTCCRAWRSSIPSFR